MFPFWAPLSMLVFGDPPLPASPFILRRLLAAGKTIRIVSLGDRMHPAIRHGQEVEIQPAQAAAIARGAVVLALSAGVLDLMRVSHRDEGRIFLAADADPGVQATVAESDILGVAALTHHSMSRSGRTVRRLRIDLTEALLRGVDPTIESGDSVRRKYDAQAVFYGSQPSERPFFLVSRVRSSVPPGGHILVAGSGAGFECFHLEQAGYSVRGVDFAPTMIEVATRKAAQRGSKVTFLAADLRSHHEPPSSLDAIVFTYDVYSFVPHRADRVKLLSRMKSWLRPSGVLYVSARMIKGAYATAVLSLERLTTLRRDSTYGDSHTRWFAPDGSMQRAFVKCFTRRALAREIHDAGFVMGTNREGHVEIRPHPSIF